MKIAHRYSARLKMGLLKYMHQLVVLVHINFDQAKLSGCALNCNLFFSAQLHALCT